MNSLCETASRNPNPVPNLYAVSAKLLQSPLRRDFTSFVPVPPSTQSPQTPPFPHPLYPLEYWKTWSRLKLSQLELLRGKQDFRDSITDPKYWQIENDHYNDLLAYISSPPSLTSTSASKVMPPSASKPTTPRDSPPIHTRPLRRSSRIIEREKRKSQQFPQQSNGGNIVTLGKRKMKTEAASSRQKR